MEFDIPDIEEREGGAEAIFEEAIAKNLLKLKKKSICRFNNL